MAESEEEQKSLLMRVKEESEKAGLKLNIQKTKIMASGPIVQACLLSCFSRVRFFATLWTVAGQAPLSTGLSRQEYWSGLLCPPPGDLLDPGLSPVPLWQVLYRYCHLGRLQSHHFMAKRWGESRNSDRFYFLGLQNRCGL